MRTELIKIIKNLFNGKLHNFILRVCDCSREIEEVHEREVAPLRAELRVQKTPMSDRRFTAQELRAMACNVEPSPNDLQHDRRSEAAAMLRYAAGVVERCEKEYAQMRKNILTWPKHGDETVFAHQLVWMLERIRGDAGNEAQNERR